MKYFKCAIFDLDGTLYNAKGMDKSNQDAIISAVSESRGVSLIDADSIIRENLNTNLDEAERPSIYRAALSLGVPDSTIKKHQLQRVWPENVLARDQELADALYRLSAKMKLALLTNTRTELALRALNQLGIAEGVFSNVKGGEALTTPKPNTEALFDIVIELSVEVENTVMIGDRWVVDLQPAVAIGMAIVKINGRDETLRWIKNYISAVS